MLELLRNIFSGNGFPERWNCGGGWHREPWWGWMHIYSDVAIWFAYFAIPIILMGFARRRRDLPFPAIFGLFASFILACGSTHLMDAIIFYWPAYRLAGLLKLFTAVISLTTVGALFYILPKALQLRGPKEAEAEIAKQTSELRELTRKLSNEIEARKVGAEQLRESREMLQLAMKANDIGFFNWNLETNRISFDSAQQRVTGIIGIDSAFHPDQFFCRIPSDQRAVVEQNVRAAIDGEVQYDAKFPFERPDGKQIWLSGKGCILRSPTGVAQRFIGINQDVTDQVLREQELSESASEARSASQQKSRFIAQVSHEIRTPLAAMLGCIDALLISIPPDETRETLRVVRSQGEMLQVLLNDVLDLSKMEAGRLQFQSGPTVIANVFADICSLMDPLAQEKGLLIRWIAESKLPQHIICDGYRLKQVFINLIGNAIKFTERGEVTIVARIQASDDNQGDLLIEVRDTGCGIPRDKIDLVFEEYEQARSEKPGAGLGLTICKRLIEMMGGTISVRSELGLGSAFEVRIPLGSLDQYQLIQIDQITKNTIEFDTAAPTIRKFQLRVLAAEDTRAIQFVLRRMLGQLVEDLVIVSNGRDAVEQVMAAESTSNPFDLVLMDIQMPEVDGTQATQQLRRERFTKPIVALTAGAMESERIACMTAGCSYFLAKPIDLHELKRILEEVSRNREELIG